MRGYKDHRAPEGRLSDALDRAIARANREPLPASDVCGYKGCGLTAGHKRDHLTIEGL